MTTFITVTVSKRMKAECLRTLHKIIANVQNLLYLFIYFLVHVLRAKNRGREPGYYTGRGDY